MASPVLHNDTGVALNTFAETYTLILQRKFSTDEEDRPTLL